MRLGLFPVIPAFRSDDIGQVAIQIRHTGIKSPGPAQEGFYAVFAIDGAMRKDKAIGLVLWRGCRGHIAISQAMDVAVFEPGRGRAKNKIDVAPDVAIVEILAPAVDKNRVLPAEKPAMMKRGAVAVHTDGQSLPYGTGRILKSDVLGGEIVGVDCRSRRLECAEGFAVNVRHAGIEVEGDDGFSGIVPNEAEKRFFPLHINQLTISPGLEMDDDGISGAAGRDRHDGLLHALELATAISGNGDAGLPA